MIHRWWLHITWINHWQLSQFILQTVSLLRGIFLLNASAVCGNSFIKRVIPAYRGPSHLCDVLFSSLSRFFLLNASAVCGNSLIKRVIPAYCLFWTFSLRRDGTPPSATHSTSFARSAFSFCSAALSRSINWLCCSISMFFLATVASSTGGKVRSIHSIPRLAHW